MTLIECFTDSHIDNVAASLRLRPDRMILVGGALAMLDGKKKQQIRVERYDYDTETAVDCLADNRPVACEPVSLTVQELVELHGGSLHPDSWQPPVNCTSRDIAGLWQVVAEEPKTWNREIMLLNQFESDSETDSGTHVTVALQGRRDSRGFAEKEETVRKLLERLERHGVIENRSSRDKLDYTYASVLLRYCTCKAGNVLEVKTLLEGREVSDGGSPFFRDCRTSVSIDWDGVPHHAGEKVPDTRNEIDVVLMHGIVPLFISCKNGNIEEEELYKLSTVAERFGGPQAKKMLIATELDRKSDSADRAFAQRARDMGVYLVKDAGKLTGEEWRQVFKAAVR